LTPTENFGSGAMSYVYLALAIVAEVTATSTLKASEEFTRPLPTLIVIFGYGCAFYLLTLVLRTIPVGIAYALWSGLGIILVAIAAAIFYKQIPDWPAVIGIALIILGVAVINLFSSTVHD
jgi:small multidrug resistance pump